MTKNLQTFVQDNFFTLIRFFASDNPDFLTDTALQKSFSDSVDAKDSWRSAMPDMETLVGEPISTWHAGHLARLKGQALPEWAKRDVYINGFSTTQHLEKLHDEAAMTLSKMKYALVRETLTRHAQLYDAPVQTKMKSLLSELYTKSPRDPLVFLEHLAHRRFAKSAFVTTTKPSAQWADSNKTTELVCQLANLTLLHIQTSLQAGNNIEQKNVPTVAIPYISVR